MIERLQNPAPSPGLPTRSESSRAAAACAAVAIGALLLWPEMVRPQTSDSPAMVAAKWAAAPSMPVAGIAAPTVADPTQQVGTPPPARDSASATTVRRTTARRVARTRFGGLYGP